MKNKLKHKVGNPELAKAMLDKRSSNASGFHLDKRTKRARTRGASLIKTLKEEKDN